MTLINSSDFAESERRLEEKLGCLQPSERITSDWKIEGSGLALLFQGFKANVSQVEAGQLE